MTTPLKLNLDKVGACASAICAVHCLLTGVAFGLLGVIGLSFLGNPFVEIAFVGTAVIIGSCAIWAGVRKHGSYLPARYFALGIACIIFSHWILERQHLAGPTCIGLFSAAGGVFLITFHVINLRLSRLANQKC